MSPRRLIILLVAALALLVVPATAAAAQTYSDTISGYEYAFTSTDGRFAGTESGALPGTWHADVQHTPLSLSCTPTATIAGGSASISRRPADELPRHAGAGQGPDQLQAERRA